MPSKKLKEHVLLNALTATNSGAWKDVSEWRRMTVEISIATTATCQIYGNCQPTQPTDATDGVKIGSDITASSIVEISAKLKWIKVKISAHTSGAVSAWVVGDSTAYGA